MDYPRPSGLALTGRNNNQERIELMSRSSSGEIVAHALAGISSMFADPNIPFLDILGPLQAIDTGDDTANRSDAADMIGRDSGADARHSPGGRLIDG